MSYSVKIIADSIAPHGARLTTYELRYPRMVHSEFMTHRSISRNASSTRAIPMAKQIEAVMRDPAYPVYWGRNQKGMQAGSELDEPKRHSAQGYWDDGRDEAVDIVEGLMVLGVHKQIAGRIIEPWAHISVVATATAGGWLNYFALRCHHTAQPEMQALAVPMARAYRDSKPVERWAGPDVWIDPDSWHLPYVTDQERLDQEVPALLALSTARVARVSYLRHDGTPATAAEDMKLYDDLAANGHWSPSEAQGYPAEIDTRSGNFIGWIQHRQTLAGSVHKHFDFGILDTVYRDRDFAV